MIYLNVEFPWTHSVARLIELIEETGMVLPEEIKDAIMLSEYAVTTRYPGDYEPVSEDEYNEAVVISEKVVDWITKKVREQR